MRRIFVLVPLLLPIPLYLVGCPQGAGREIFVDDAATDGGDLDAEGGADATSSDANAEAATGALCGVSGRNDCGPFMTCDPSQGCVECTADSDCPAAARFCIGGQCVLCRPSGGTGDCAPEQACFSGDFECHPRCTVAGGCSGGMLCDEASGACVGCRSPADCTSGLCSTATRLCVECETDETCPAQRPRCRRLTGTCVACTSNDDCGLSAPICDPVTFACRRGCLSDAECPDRRCDVATATCVDKAPVDAGSDGG